MKIQALFSNGKYWQKKAQFKNSKKQNKHNIVLKWQRLQNVGQANCGRKWHKIYIGIQWQILA